jgi:hypothetical protein
VNSISRTHLYNSGGVRASGFKDPRQFEKLHGTRACSCGRTISANKIRCAACQDAIEAVFAAASAEQAAA